MIKVIHLGDDGTEMATIEVDDFTIEVIYSGIAEMLARLRSPIQSWRPPPAICLLRPASAARRS